ncbi:MAG: hypothetical protein ABR949_05745 [Candidatus Aquilonibacter sp.]|jgi:hypothetical protein
MTVTNSLHKESVVNAVQRPITEVPKVPRLPHAGIVYVPAAVLKPAEARALHTLQGSIANGVYPLIIARAVPPERTEIDDETGERVIKSQPSLFDHVKAQRGLIIKALGVEQQFFNSGVTRLMLDTSALDKQQERATLGDFRESLGDNDCRFVVPIISPDRDENNRLAAAWDRKYFTGVALRVTISKSASFPQATGLLRLLDALRIKTQRVDLVIDAGKIDEQNICDVLPAITAFHLAMAGATRWRSVILTSNGFPKSISALEFNIKHRLKRWDLVLWKRHRHALRDTACDQLPIYSDCGMVHVSIAEGGKIPQPNMRYTLERDWLVYRREHDEAAMRVVCGAVTEEDSFRGDTFSEGDAWIKGCADGKQRQSYAQTWLRAGWQHHIAFVVAQLRGRT